jgi:small-conductance mechanosensitive channel
VRVGDYVRLETGDEGHIRDITWRNSVLENPQKNFVVVPNGKLANLLVTNFSLPQKYTVASLTIGVSHDANLDKVESVTMDVCHDVLKEHYKDNDFDIFLRFFAFAESSINFRVSLKVKEITDQYVLIHEIIKSLQKKYREEGIVMPYPIMNVNLSTDKGLSEKQVIETDL